MAITDAEQVLVAFLAKVGVKNETVLVLFVRVAWVKPDPCSESVLCHDVLGDVLPLLLKDLQKLKLLAGFKRLKVRYDQCLGVLGHFYRATLIPVVCWR